MPAPPAPNRTGGEGVIEEKNSYDTKALKALICYPNQSIAERVSKRNVIEYDNFKFKVKLIKKDDVNNSENSKINQKSDSSSVLKSSINNARCQGTLTKSEESNANSNALKITDLSGLKSLTIDKVHNRFLFVKDKIVAIEIDQNTAIVKFDSVEGIKTVLKMDYSYIVVFLLI